MPAPKAESEDDGVGQPVTENQEEATQTSVDSVAESQPADDLAADDAAADSVKDAKDEASAAVAVRSSANMPTQVLPSPAPSVLPDASVQAKDGQVEKAVTDQETTVIPPINDDVTPTDRD